jgi:hypothetical protein
VLDALRDDAVIREDTAFFLSPADFLSLSWHEHGGDEECLHIVLHSHKLVRQLVHSVATALAHQTSISLHKG